MPAELSSLPCPPPGLESPRSQALRARRKWGCSRLWLLVLQGLPRKPCEGISLSQRSVGLGQKPELEGEGWGCEWLAQLGQVEGVLGTGSRSRVKGRGARHRCVDGCLVSEPRGELSSSVW